mgnify:CR=1 FL=1
MQLTALKDLRNTSKGVRPAISIIIPAYNEAERITRTLKILSIFLKERKDVEILIIMDGCTDQTPDIVMSFAVKNPMIMPIVFSRRLGKGGALLKGFEKAQGDILVLCDADFPTTLRDFMRIIELARDYDMVIGSRYARGAHFVTNWSFTRLFLSRAFNALVRILFWSLKQFQDTQCGIKAMKRSLLTIIRDKFFANDFTIDVNILYLAVKFGARIREVGILWRHMDKGSKVSSQILRTALRMAISLLKLRVKTLKLRWRLKNTKLKLQR